MECSPHTNGKLLWSYYCVSVHCKSAIHDRLAYEHKTLDKNSVTVWRKETEYYSVSYSARIVFLTYLPDWFYDPFCWLSNRRACIKTSSNSSQKLTLRDPDRCGISPEKLASNRKLKLEYARRGCRWSWWGGRTECRYMKSTRCSPT